MDRILLEESCEILDSRRIPITASNRKEGPYPYYGANGIQDYVDDYIFDDELVLLAEDGGNFGSKERPIAYRVSGKCWVNNHAHVLKPKDGMNVDYLCYSLMFYDTEKLVNGATRQKLTQAMMRKILIPKRSISEQKKIVDTLNTIQNSIAKQTKRIKLLDNLIKARFVEMFGLPGTDPFGYGKVKLGECCEINPKKTKNARLADGVEVSFVPMSSVSEKGEIDPSDIRKYEVVKKGFTYFTENDVLFAKITPCMENGKGAIAKGLMNGIGFGSTEFHVLRSTHGLSNPYWIYTITSFKTFRKDAESNMTGSAGQRRTPASFLEGYEISLPPIELQNQFATFVAQIDKSKFALQNSIISLMNLWYNINQYVCERTYGEA